MASETIASIGLTLLGLHVLSPSLENCPSRACYPCAYTHCSWPWRTFLWSQKITPEYQRPSNVISCLQSSPKEMQCPQHDMTSIKQRIVLLYPLRYFSYSPRRSPDPKALELQGGDSGALEAGKAEPPMAPGTCSSSHVSVASSLSSTSIFFLQKAKIP